MPRRRRKERYIDRWLKEHPRLTLYLTKEEFDLASELASYEGMTVKDFIAKTIRELIAKWKGCSEKGKDI
jgi:hypothetical protein